MPGDDGAGREKTGITPMNELTSIAGQVAVVSGGTAGIGLACVERFAAEGAKVAFVGRDPDKGRAVAERIAADGSDVLFLEMGRASGRERGCREVWISVGA